MKKISDGISALDRHLVDSSAIQAVGLLTKDEIDELRTLIELGDKAAEFAASRMDDPIALGMYLQLSDLGFIHCVSDMSGGHFLIGVDPKASWAVARFDGKEAERLEKLRAEERERKRASRRQWGFALLGWSLGLVSDPARDLLYWIGRTANSGLTTAIEAITRALGQ